MHNDYWAKQFENLKMLGLITSTIAIIITVS